MKRTAVYAGSFDPITYGHMNVIEQASKVFDTLYIAVGTNTDKKGMFSFDKRVHQIQEAILDLSVVVDLCEIKVALFSGMLVDFMKTEKIPFIVRGLRDHADFDFESHMAHINKKLDPNVSTVWFHPTRHEHTSSSLVRQMITLKSSLYTTYTPVRVESF